MWTWPVRDRKGSRIVVGLIATRELAQFGALQLPDGERFRRSHRPWLGGPGITRLKKKNIDRDQHRPQRSERSPRYRKPGQDRIPAPARVPGCDFPDRRA